MKISKLIPFNIRIKSLYWVRKEREINSDLTILFDKIDNDHYEEATILLKQLEDKWLLFSQTAPEWFALEYIPQFTRAGSMLSFLKAE